MKRLSIIKNDQFIERGHDCSSKQCRQHYPNMSAPPHSNDSGLSLLQCNSAYNFDQSYDRMPIMYENKEFSAETHGFSRTNRIHYSTADGTETYSDSKLSTESVEAQKVLPSMSRIKLLKLRLRSLLREQKNHSSLHGRKVPAQSDQKLKHNRKKEQKYKYCSPVMMAILFLLKDLFKK